MANPTPSTLGLSHQEVVAAAMLGKKRGESSPILAERLGVPRNTIRGIWRTDKARRKSLPEAPVQWAPERETELERLWGSLTPTSEIASILGAPSVRAVESKAQRLGLGMRPHTLDRRRLGRPKASPLLPPMIGEGEFETLARMEACRLHLEDLRAEAGR